MPREHGDDGAFIETIRLDDVREVFNTVDGPVILSADVADGLDCSRETARRKLKELHERGDLERRKVSRRVIYWEPEEESAGAPTDTVRDDPDPSPGHTPGDTGTAAHADESGGTPPGVDLGSLSFKRDLTPPRRTQLEAWLRYAADTDGVQKSDFEEWWRSDRHAATGYNAGSFWEAFAKATMVQSDQFTKPNNRTYRYIGDDSGRS
jgi:hypothetical protein